MKYAWLFLVLLVAGCVGGASADTTGQQTGPVETSDIRITSSGFTPNEITVAQGTAVTWTNDDTAPHWVASARHPTHTVYPGSNIENCGTPQQSASFDACGELLPGETYTFTFNHEGEWFYHDHLNPNSFGKVIVTG